MGNELKFDIKPYLGKTSKKGRVKYFTVKGPQGSLDIGITYALNKGKIEFQVDELNLGSGWTRECPDTRKILLRKTGLTFKGKRQRSFWLQSVYNGEPGPELIAGESTEQPEPSILVPQYEGTPKESRGSYEILIQGPTDIFSVTKRRGEQKQLRNSIMLGRDSLPCAICGRDFAPSHLITAHIKKRSQANDTERLDPFIVVPMCVMGCDALFEQGWIGLNDGLVIRINLTESTAAVRRSSKS